MVPCTTVYRISVCLWFIFVEGIHLRSLPVRGRGVQEIGLLRVSSCLNLGYLQANTVFFCTLETCRVPYQSTQSGFLSQIPNCKGCLPVSDKRLLRVHLYLEYIIYSSAQVFFLTRYLVVWAIRLFRVSRCSRCLPGTSFCKVPICKRHMTVQVLSLSKISSHLGCLPDLFVRSVVACRR